MESGRHQRKSETNPFPAFLVGVYATRETDEVSISLFTPPISIALVQLATHPVFSVSVSSSDAV